jgi:phosphodiesterase/alkaline phosphatase D-like protein
MHWAVGVAVLLALALALAAAALGAAPVASTGPATAVGSGSATVSGAVNPGGQSTTWYVEYGTSTSYGSKTAAVGAGSGATPVSVSANLTGLKPGTTYHYRVVATNTAGTSHGGDAVFATLVPPDVSTGGASSITPSSATLNGVVDANGRSTTYYFDYGTSTSYGTRTSSRSTGTATSAQPVSAGISGLQAGRTYHFRIVATSDAGTTVGNDATFATRSAPTALTGDVSSITPTAATLRGAVTPNGLSTTWWFEYGATTSYTSKSSAQSAGSDTTPRSVSQAIGSLRAGSTYHYRLVARNSHGTVAGADRSFSTIGAPLSQTGAAQVVRADAAVLTGTLDTRGRSTTWWFEYGSSTSYGTSTPAKSSGSKAGVQAVSAQITGLAPATGYHYRLVVRSDAGTAHGADATFATLGVTLATAAQQTVYGGRVRLSGIVPTHQANEQVVLYAQAYGEGSPRSVATVLSSVDGSWQYLARPRIGTTYTASWRNGLSVPVVIAVHPRMTFTRLSSGRFVVRVFADRSFAHRLVQLQRWNGLRWVTLRRVRLGVRSRAEFRATLPAGRSTLRSSFSVNQAGAGYLGATSRTIKLTIRR